MMWSFALSEKAHDIRELPNLGVVEGRKLDGGIGEQTDTGNAVSCSYHWGLKNAVSQSHYFPCTTMPSPYMIKKLEIKTSPSKPFQKVLIPSAWYKLRNSPVIPVSLRDPTCGMRTRSNSAKYQICPLNPEYLPEQRFWPHQEERWWCERSHLDDHEKKWNGKTWYLTGNSSSNEILWKGQTLVLFTCSVRKKILNSQILPERLPPILTVAKINGPKGFFFQMQKIWNAVSCPLQIISYKTSKNFTKNRKTKSFFQNTFSLYLSNNLIRESWSK